MDAFTRSFLETALWSSTDESREDGGEPMDANYSVDDFDPKCAAALARECAQFQETHAADIQAVFDACHNPRSWVEAQFGHDFWLTRCGHGAGFWDGDYPDDMGERLTDSSKAWGNVDLYVNDGVVYASGYERGVV